LGGLLRGSLGRRDQFGGRRRGGNGLLLRCLAVLGVCCWDVLDATYTTMKTATKMETKPAHVSQPIEWNFRILAQKATTTVAINDHQTVQAACVDRAFRPVETPKIPDPVQRT